MVIGADEKEEEKEEKGEERTEYECPVRKTENGRTNYCEH